VAEDPLRRRELGGDDYLIRCNLIPMYVPEIVNVWHEDFTPVTAAKPAQFSSADKPGLAAAQFHAGKAAPRAPAQVPDAKISHKKSVDKPALAAARPMTKRVELAKTDPLAPLPDKHPGRTKETPTGR